MHERQVRERRGGGHGRKLHLRAHEKPRGHPSAHAPRREDEDALTDLLNERMRSGLEPAMMSQDGQRLTIIFRRQTDTERS